MKQTVDGRSVPSPAPPPAPGTCPPPRARTFLARLALVTLLMCSPLLGCGTSEMTVKEFECGPGSSCPKHQVCEGGRCVTADNDGDGWARDRDCDDSSDRVYPGAPEVCANRVDDNCNGKTDEEPCVCKDGATRACGPDQGQCKPGLQTCRKGAWGDCQGAVMAKAEACNGKDDDCDGAVDEDLIEQCYDGPTGTAGIGACKAGTRKCSSGSWLGCKDQVGPSRETCNGLDDDCNGETDDGLARECFSGDKTKAGVGPCRSGKQHCRGGKWSGCEGEVLPVSESCNGKDDDCDGLPDQGLQRPCYTGTPGTPGIGPCKGGVQRCIGATWGTCLDEVTPMSELCNSADDDCDGQVDEDYPQKGQPCKAGTGACERPGTFECAKDGKRVHCPALKGTPATARTTTATAYRTTRAGAVAPFP